ncbi:MAG TPA: GspH/FimT family pseudopilin [Steroidobacteraceae bacterium]
MSRERSDAAGFTLTELAVVIAIATILSAFAISRINTASFDTEGYANQVKAAIRYAQKIAVSQRRNVAVTVSAGAVSLTYPDAPLSGAPVHRPPGTDAFTVNKPTSVTLSGTLSGSSVTFSALGKPVAGGGTIIVSGGDISPITITVESETGYVH